MAKRFTPLQFILNYARNLLGEVEFCREDRKTNVLFITTCELFMHAQLRLCSVYTA